MLPERTDPFHLCAWLLLSGLLRCASCVSQNVPAVFENKTGQEEGAPRVFSPRMDYDEWTPLGRGDPLKNNPTFDYVPPVLDRVQYWLDSHTTEPSPKRDVLVLGVTAKKTSPKIPEQFLKFVDGPKFTRDHHHHHHHHHRDVSYRNEFTGSTGAEPPKLVRASNFRNDYRHRNGIQSLPSSGYYAGSYFGQKSKPYATMLPPPFVRDKKEKIASFGEPSRQFATQTEEGPREAVRGSHLYGLGQSDGQTLSRFSPSENPGQRTVVSQVETIKSASPSPSLSTRPTKFDRDSATTSSVSFEKSNLIYQSTQTLAAGWPASSNGLLLRTTARPIPDRYEIVAASSSNHEVTVDARDPGTGEQQTSEKVRIVLADSSSNSQAQPSETTVAIVMPSNYSNEDDSNRDAPETAATPAPTEDSATTEEPKEPKEPKAETISPMRPQLGPSHAPMHPLGIAFRPPNPPPLVPMFSPITEMRAPPPPAQPIVSEQPGHRLAFSPFSAASTTPTSSSTDRFVDPRRPRPSPGTATSIFTTPTASPFFPTVPSATENPDFRDPQKTTRPKEEKEEQGREERVTTVPSLTTDPIFSHYKQPEKPIRGPMYLIIQGHSKVKTYKPTASKRANENEIAETLGDDRLSEFERFVREKTRSDSRANAAAIEKKRAAAAEDESRVEKLSRARQTDLASLVESTFESFASSPSYSATENGGESPPVTVPLGAF